MPLEPPGDHSEHVDMLQAYARDRLGVEIQAISRIGRPCRANGVPEVWLVMTEGGSFWLAERDGVIELFLAATVGERRRTSLHCRSPRRAAQRFLELHP